MATKKKTFEENLAALEEIVSALEKGDVPLEEALTQFQQGMALSKELTDTLTKAQVTLTKVMTEAGVEEPFEEENGGE